MIKAVKKNKVLFIVMAAVLILGACLAVVLNSAVNTARAEQQIQTAESEAAIETALAEETPVETAKPSETSGPFSAEVLQRLVMNKEYRRSYIIPVMDSVVVPEADTWSSIEPEDYFELKAEALSKTMQYAQDFFGFELKDTNINFWYYTDTSGLRSDFVKVATMDDAIVCVMTADTMELINIDYNFIPSQTRPDEGDVEHSIVADEESAIADKIAGVFGTTVEEIKVGGGGSYKQEYRTKSFNVIMNDGKFVRFGLLNGECYSVSVYPTLACMYEYVYFEADIQRDPSVMQLASPQDFEEGEPASGDMTEGEALEMYMSFLNLANGTGDYDEPSMTFYIDNSRARENYWYMEGEKLTMDVASKSRFIVHLTCNGLWNPEYDLTKIGYGGMGGSEYVEYIENIMGSIFGDDFLRVEPNAVYDGHYCTEIAFMADNSAYEFMFEDGKLLLISYTFDFAYFMDATGWEADNVYVNSTTGEEYIPQ